MSDRPDDRSLNIICVAAGEVRQSADPGMAGRTFVMDVAELLWEPIAP